MPRSQTAMRSPPPEPRYSSNPGYGPGYRLWAEWEKNAKCVQRTAMNVHGATI